MSKAKRCVLGEGYVSWDGYFYYKEREWGDEILLSTDAPKGVYRLILEPIRKVKKRGGK